MAPTRSRLRAHSVKYTDLSAREIAEEAMQIAGKICIYTNESISVEEL